MASSFVSYILNGKKRTFLNIEILFNLKFKFLKKYLQKTQHI